MWFIGGIIIFFLILSVRGLLFYRFYQLIVCQFERFRDSLTRPRHFLNMEDLVSMSALVNGQFAGIFELESAPWKLTNKRGVTSVTV